MKKGFTIIESLVAIAILTAVIIGATSAVQSGLSSYIFSKDQIVSFYLAQEGFEELRNIRDENALNSRPWLTGIAGASSDPCAFGSSCMASPVESSVLTRCSALGACPVLREEAATGFFGYNAAWPATQFTRDISLVSIGADEVAVTVKVTWTKGATVREFKARENLFRWQ
jgi:prepilin-type N-terminal cleavage/methylation domain-containing protein